ncbi:MAG: hypothetical protein J1E96_07885, partial [Ruminococcus sp.]|nr:hypothetical protein [Ruminococcus sp.]
AWEERTPDFIVNSDKIADNGITTAKLADRSVTWAKIADGAISSAKMGDGAVTTSRIANGAVTEEKLSDELKAVIYANNSVPEIAPYGSATISFESATISFTGTDRPDNFSGKYESSKNKYIIYGKIAVSETYNSDKINLPENYAPICDSCAIGVGSARNGKKHYIVNVNSTESNIEFEVFNMDGTVPTEDDEVTFTVTALKR